jgi:Fe-S-cluster containining protein
MLSDQGCTIYEHRPRTCRTYDCRVFPAAGVFPDEPEKSLVAERARQWQFSYPHPLDRALHDEILAAAAAVRRDESLPATAVAVRAVRSVIERA